MTEAVHLGAMLALAAVWLTAGVLADGLPDAPSARALRQRSGSVLALVTGGLAVLVALALIPAPEWSPATPGTIDPRLLSLLLPLVPAVFAAGFTLRRVARIRTATSAFTSAPGVPLPPALRAGAAHPLLAIPLQATALAAALSATVSGTLATGWLDPAGSGAIGVIVTGLALATLALAIRHALRHSRLAETAITIRRASAAALTR
ncbi:hypothetical protein J2S43_006964 [Catenuloplanes nepalensis]|uniref:Uncharacterized protein n=1 Tax=Catenuloplanes nepalensis TaxID=587533 RepID=A0ABT9N435_9ACTN|nr:hypothetical protein [Catenuloplanes nepalensis]MDP9798452.1 hypothetical protein [Catenuloplanes nepalensis]